MVQWRSLDLGHRTTLNELGKWVSSQIRNILILLVLNIGSEGNDQIYNCLPNHPIPHFPYLAPETKIIQYPGTIYAESMYLSPEANVVSWESVFVCQVLKPLEDRRRHWLRITFE